MKTFNEFWNNVLEYKLNLKYSHIEYKKVNLHDCFQVFVVHILKD